MHLTNNRINKKMSNINNTTPKNVVFHIHPAQNGKRIILTKAFC